MRGSVYSDVGISGGISVPGSVYDRIADYWDKEIPSELNRDQLRNLLEMIIPAYHTAILEHGIPPYSYAPESSANADLFGFLTTQTSQPRDTIQDALFSLEQCTLTGKIDGQYLRPETWAEVKPPSIVERFITAANPGTDAIGKQFNKVLIGGAIVITVVLIAQTAIKAAISRQT